MKIYSSDSITKDDVQQMVGEAVISASGNAQLMTNAVDEKLNKKIKSLERLVLLSFAANALLALGAYFVKL